MADKIGDPLANAAQSGVLGQRRSLTSTNTNTNTTQEKPAAVQTQIPTEKEQPERVKRTLMFTPARAKWLKVQAAQEDKEMSEIVEEALALYEKMNS